MVMWGALVANFLRDRLVKNLGLLEADLQAEELGSVFKVGRD